jgi:dTDP-4-dehydrorhamnose 3,5-epimerase
MQVIETPFEGLVQLIPTLHHDGRGYFYESYKKDTFKAFGIDVDFVQENQSFSKKNVIRGLHFQLAPFAQAKLASVQHGKVLDVVLDLREESRTFGKVYTCILDGETRNMLFVPEGFAHGFAALEPSLFMYKCSQVYHKPMEAGIYWNDPALNIDWMVPDPIVSEKDQHLPTLEEFLRKSVISRG